MGCSLVLSAHAEQTCAPEDVASCSLQIGLGGPSKAVYREEGDGVQCIHKLFLSLHQYVAQSVVFLVDSKDGGIRNLGVLGVGDP